MLSPDWLINNLDDITVMYSDLSTEILKSIARHVADSLKIQTGIMPTTRKQIEAAQTAGILRDEIITHVSESLSISIPEIRALFEAAGTETLRYDNEIYREAGLPPVIIQQSPAIQNILESRIGKFTGNLHRLTGTIAVNTEELFERTLNTAFGKVTTGTHSYMEALNEGMDEMLREGVTVFSYTSGRNISVEAAVLMNLRTSIAQSAGEITRQGMVENGASYTETSAHIGARNKGEGFKNHESWQGRTFYFREIAVEPNTNETEYPDFVATTGYGDVAGLEGANCRHSYSPFYPGVSIKRWSDEELKKYSEKTYTFTGADGKEKTVDAYTASQIQRGLEREIRNAKRAVSVKEVAELDTTKEKKDLRASQKRLKQYLDDTGLRRQEFRERIASK